MRMAPYVEYRVQRYPQRPSSTSGPPLMVRLQVPMHRPAMAVCSAEFDAD
jgi:hypothetical protein